MSEALDYAGMTVAELDALLDRLESEEAEVSTRRARLHDRIDFARHTTTDDKIAVERLEKLIANERELAERRRELQKQIERLTTARHSAR